MEITIPPTLKEKRPTGRAPNFSPEYYMMNITLQQLTLSYWEAELLADYAPRKNSNEFYQNIVTDLVRLL